MYGHIYEKIDIYIYIYMYGHIYICMDIYVNIRIAPHQVLSPKLGTPNLKIQVSHMIVESGDRATPAGAAFRHHRAPLGSEPQARSPDPEN